MTTRITVHAGHGWPVDVTPVSVGGSAVAGPSRVPPGETREFIVHAGQDLMIHEVQPGETAAETEAA